MKKVLLIIGISALVIKGMLIYTKLAKRGIVSNNKKQSVQIVNTGDKNMDIKELEIIPTLESKSKAKNYVWAGNFQLVWNDFMNELVKGPIKFDGNQPETANQLNKQNFTIEDLSENAYYKKWGEISPLLKTEIENGIKTKFNETSDLLNEIDWTPSQEEYIKKYLFYSMLKKNFTFTEKLDNWGKGSFKGIAKPVEYFGINGSDNRAGNVIHTVFYNNENDHAVYLESKQGDIVYLFRTDEEGSLEELYKKMFKKRNEEISKINEEARKRGVLVDINADLWEKDEFKAPMLDFNITQNFDELCNKKILSKDSDKYYIITQALQNMQFQMDEAGAKLKSEAAMEVGETGALPNIDIEPVQYRYFHYTGRYAIFVTEDIGKEEPYFAMLVNDPSVLQSDKKEDNSKEDKNLPRVKPPEGYQPKPTIVKPAIQPIDTKLQDKFITACRYGNKNDAEELLKQGANVNASVLGQTPLKNAILGDKPEIVKLLLQNGVTVTKYELTLAKNHKNEEIIKLLESPVKPKPITEEQPKKEEKKIDPNTFPAYFSLDSVKKWIDAGGNVNAKDSKGSTPLHYASGHCEDFYDPTRLTAPQMLPDMEVIKLLLEKGANINAKNDKGQTPLYNSFGWGWTSLLLDNHAEVNIKNNDGNTPLHHASLTRHTEDVKLLLEHKANVNAKNNEGNTPLHIIPLTSFFDNKYASKQLEIKRDSDIVKLLLEQRADANIKNNDGKTPLDIARDRNYTELVQLFKGELHPQTEPDMLFDEAFDKELSNILDEPRKWFDDQIHPIDWNRFIKVIKSSAYFSPKDKSGHSFLARVIMAPTPNTANSQNEPEQRAQAVEELLKRGAKLEDVTDETGKTALMMTIEKGNLPVIKVILKYTSNVNAADENGNTALMYTVNPHYRKLAGFPLRFEASYTGHIEMIQELLKAGADINHKNNQGKTALAMAKDTLTQWSGGQSVRDDTIYSINDTKTLEQIISILESAGAKE